MKSKLHVGAALAAICLLSGVALATDPSGTWTFPGDATGNGGESTLALAVQEGHLEGTFRAAGQRGRSVKIRGTSITGDTLNFTVTRTVRGTRVVSKYSGKLIGLWQCFLVVLQTN